MKTRYRGVILPCVCSLIAFSSCATVMSGRPSTTNLRSGMLALCTVLICSVMFLDDNAPARRPSIYIYGADHGACPQAVQLTPLWSQRTGADADLGASLTDHCVLRATGRRHAHCVHEVMHAKHKVWAMCCAV